MTATPMDTGHAIPRGAILGAAALIVGTILFAALTHPEVRPAPVDVATRSLFFGDRPDGAVIVTDAATGREVAVVEPGTGGFVRGMLRALTRERSRRGAGASVAFQLAESRDGHLRLVDPVTTEVIELDAFGSTNAGVFRRFLKP
jgi:putative photosynthetic complex assembly protein